MKGNQNAALVLVRAAQESPAHDAIVDRDGSTSYAELLARSAAAGAALVARGIGPDRPVAILLQRDVDAVAALFGTLAVGGIAVFVNETLRPRQIEHILTHSGARLLVTSAEILARLPRPLRRDVPVLDVQAIPPVHPAGAPLAPVLRRATDVAQIIYTSGSSGPPKGVAVSHANLGAAAASVTSYLEITGTDRVASVLPFSFVYGLSQLLCAVRAGATLVIERSPVPQQIVATLRARQVTVLGAVPTLWMRLLQVAGFRDPPLPALRVMTSAGGRLYVEAVRALRRAQPDARLYLMYGLTEALRSTYLPPEEVDRRPDSIGRAIPGAEIHVLREDGTPTAPGEIGELVHAGPTVTLGYWNDPALTAEVYRPPPHPLQRTGSLAERVVFSGDLVRRDAEGFLYFVGRKDRIIKTLGYRVGPDDITDVLRASGEVVDAVAIGEPDPAWGERAVAFVVLAEGGSVDRLKAYCGRELPRYLQPARIEVRDTLPLLPNGKYDVGAMAPSCPNDLAE